MAVEVQQRVADIIASSGQRVRELRAVRGLTQAEASTRAKISLQTWSRIERGVPQNYTLETFAAVATALDVPFRELFVEEGDDRRVPGTVDDLTRIIAALNEPARVGLLTAIRGFRLVPM